MDPLRIAHRSPLAKAAVSGLALAALAASAGALGVGGHKTTEKPMLTGLNGWTVDPVFTVSDTIDGYRPVGILAGLGAYRPDWKTVRVLANHELNDSVGKSYRLANGTTLTGSRVSVFDFDRYTRCIETAGPAYDTVYDRAGNVVTTASQINEDGDPTDGFDRFCSSVLVEAGTFGFVDTIYFTGEESGRPFHPHGGTEWALDVENGELWACPELGRSAWENVTPVKIADRTKVALLLGDDSQSAPLYLWIGEKSPNGSFLERNGLARGRLFVWKADNGDLTPEDWNGDGTGRTGTFVPIAARDPSQAGQPGYDALGYLDIDTLQAAADALGAFSFSRPEDLHVDPKNHRRVAFASTGRGGLFPSDNWGTTYLIEVRLEGRVPTADIVILYDGDDQAVPDAGLRSPDNLTIGWDRHIYVQEDRSTSPSSLFGGTTGEEASIWQIATKGPTVALTRIARIDRTAVAPSDATDADPTDLGDWESSGILDVTRLFKTNGGETLLLVDVQAHSVRDGSIGGSSDLVQGGQILFLSWVRGGRPTFVEKLD